MNTFWLFWTYIANYAEKPMRIEAETAEAAYDKFRKFSIFSDDFFKRGTIYIYDHEPVFVKRGGE